MARKALLVGINKYRMPGSNLSGCVNDILDMRRLLKDVYGWTNKEIRLLVDERATKQRIMNRLLWLIAGMKGEGDEVLWHQSSHGSQVADRNGDELNDHMDEILVPYDMDWDGTYITDDEIRSVFMKVPPGVKVTILFDSCHSGTATRAFGHAPLVNSSQHRPRLLVPPPDVIARVEGEAIKSHTFKSVVNVQREAITPIVPTEKGQISFWAGCRENQTSADANFGGRPNGAFTYAFLRALKMNPHQSQAEVLEGTRKFLEAEGYDQVPQLEIEEGAGSADTPFLT